MKQIGHNSKNSDVNESTEQNSGKSDENLVPSSFCCYNQQLEGRETSKTNSAASTTLCSHIYHFQEALPSSIKPAGNPGTLLSGSQSQSVFNPKTLSDFMQMEEWRGTRSCSWPTYRSSNSNRGFSCKRSNGNTRNQAGRKERSQVSDGNGV